MLLAMNCRRHSRSALRFLLALSGLALAWIAAPAQTDAPAPDADGESFFYRLRAGDSVRITVFNEPDLQVQQKLDTDGVIVVPMLGRVALAGMALREAEAYLESRFISEDLLIRPQVTVSIAEHAEQVFYIFGQVNSPGAKRIPPGRQSIDILEAITLGGDLAQYARRNEVILRRPIPGTNEEERIVIDLDQLLRGNRRGNTSLVEVFPQDIIFVPERRF
jgi:polysaccharide export outer membrane protein